MKFLKKLLFILMNIIMVPLAVIGTYGSLYYTLPSMSTTVLGTFLVNIGLTGTSLFWVTISNIVGFIIFYILLKIFNRRASSKYKNLFTHLYTWLIAIVTVGLTITTFILSTNLTSSEILFSTTRKIGIGVSIIALIGFHMISGKISKIINRRIQAYENAKEIQVVGRGSILFTNLLKLIEVIFPEIIILALICFCVSWNVASYFLVMIIAFLIPMLGNIECDLNIRSEIKYNLEKKEDKLVNKIKGDK